MSSTDITAQLWQALLSMQRYSWEQGVASHAALDGGRVSLAISLAHDAVVRQAQDGRLGAIGETSNVDCGSCVEAVGHLAHSGDAGAIDALEKQRWWLLRHCPRADSGVLLHVEGLDEVWVDSVYMVVPALVATGDFAPADMQYRMHRQHLWNPETGLYGHIHNVVTDTPVRDVAWSSGNGWVAAGLARSVHCGGDALPQEMRNRWQRETQDLLTACAGFVRPDGRFHNVMNDPTTFVDGTAGLMFAYAAFTGVADGWLDHSWTVHAETWLAGAMADVDEYGFVHQVCGSPRFEAPGTSAEAQAFALMALSAQQRVTTSASS